MEEVQVGRIYKHFKGNMYKVLCIAMHTETNEDMVIYQDINNKTKIYARPYTIFISKVDKDKYPDVNQEYRFQRQ